MVSQAQSSQAQFSQARAIADAVLYEGYLLYPYRATAPKNQLRWQFGVIAPEGYAEQGDGTVATMTTRLPAQVGEGGRLTVMCRFLHLRSRGVARLIEGVPHPVTALEVGDQTLRTWDEADEVEVVWTAEIVALLAQPVVRTFSVQGDEQVDEPVAGQVRVTQRSWPLSGSITMAATEHQGGQVSVTVQVSNLTGWPAVDDAVIDPARQEERVAMRDMAMRRSLLGTHLLLALESGAFASSIDRPAWAGVVPPVTPADGLWPVLLDPLGATALAAPLILPDLPSVADASPRDFYDGTEIDELLTLRTQTMTPDEKAVVRQTDGRAAQLVDDADAVDGDQLARLHATVTSPDTDHVMVGGARVSRGDIVELRPGGRSADAQDMFLTGRMARVEKVLFDLEGHPMLAVNLVDDPVADLKAQTGRYLYFAPEEVVCSA